MFKIKKTILIIFFSLILIPTDSFSKEIFLKCIQFKTKNLETEEVRNYNKYSTVYSILFFRIKDKKIKIMKGTRIYNLDSRTEENMEFGENFKKEFKLSNQTDIKLIFHNDDKIKFIVDKLDYHLKYILTDKGEVEYRCEKIDKLI